MSFKCQQCGKQVPPGVKQERVVTKTRKVKYEELRDGRLVAIGWGEEIVKELTVCLGCFELFSAEGGE